MIGVLSAFSGFVYVCWRMHVRAHTHIPTPHFFVCLASKVLFNVWSFFVCLVGFCGLFFFFFFPTRDKFKIVDILRRDNPGIVWASLPDLFNGQATR